MSKRSFLAGSAGILTLAALAPHTSVIAQGVQPEPGKNVRLIDPPIRTAVADGKIEVLEFFWYACPHCRSLEPVIDDWAKRLPADVEFRKIHVAFRGDAHQRLFYTLQALGEESRLGPKVFEAIHDQRKRLTSEGEIVDWAVSQGLDKTKFVDAWRSFGVNTQMRQAKQAIDAYNVEGVPALAVNGRYYTAPSMVGSNGGALQLVDTLIAMERKRG